MFLDRLLEHWDKVLSDIGSEENRQRRINTLSWDDVFSLLMEAVLVDIENVAQFCHDRIENGQSIDLPNIRPVFPVMWFEWQHDLLGKHTQVMASDGTIRSNYSFPFRKQGCLLFINKEDDKSIEIGTISLKETRSDDVLFVGLEIWECNLQGQLLRSYPLSDYLQRVLENSGDMQILPPACIPMLALSFMHCKNTTLETIYPSDKLNYSRIKRGKRPLISYKVLDIRPVKRLLETEGELNRVGLKRALHICRGHFKDYTEKGLFGKLHGLYWWDAQTRGEIKAGVALKHYRVLSK